VTALPIRGALAAALTPLREGGEALDEDAFGPYAEFLVAGGVAGILALGTTGEGILLRPEERRRAVALFAEGLAGRAALIAHCGAQSTAETAALAAAAAAAGADAVAVISPPYFRLDDRALLAHLTAAAEAAAPLPFYVYEFAAASGYAVPLEVLAALRESAPNLAGLKVSDTPWEAFARYLVEGLDVFVGPEALIGEGMRAGAAGAVSALASALPERVAAAVADPDGREAAAMDALRARIETFPRHAALKRLAAGRGVPMREDVRRPLRGLTADERRELDGWAEREARPGGRVVPGEDA
jgi:dihydrodipicolinate synthase/N-acetylneuraminate lyase